MSIEKAVFGKLESGEDVTLFTVRNQSGLVLKMMDYGAIIVSMETPDKGGNLANITLSFPSLEGYLPRHPYYGATIGRFGNRIANARFSLDGKDYELAANNGPNHLHGGSVGFDRVLWDAEEVVSEEGQGIQFSYLSPAGEEGYPGNLKVGVLYFLSNSNELKIEFKATTDQATPVNLTNHTYWNLAGAGSGKILDHVAEVQADKFLEVDDTLIPTGTLLPVIGTPLDFTSPAAIGARIHDIEADPVGYDHCYSLRSQDGSLALAARVEEPTSGRVMEVYTTQPGMQLYTGNFLDGSEATGGFGQYEAFCLETQHFPDAPNQPSFKSAILRPGETFHQTTVHKFLVQD